MLFQCQDEPEDLGTQGTAGEAMDRDLEAGGRGRGVGATNTGSTPATIRLYVPKSDPFAFLPPLPKPLAPATTPPSFRGTVCPSAYTRNLAVSLMPPLSPLSHQSLGSVHSVNTVANPLSSLLSLPGVQGPGAASQLACLLRAHSRSRTQGLSKERL